jgi:hypothetical protein
MTTPNQNASEEIKKNDSGASKEQSSAPVVNPPDPSDKISKFITIVVAAFFFYASVVWQNLPLDANGGYNIRWLITGGVVLISIAAMLVLWRKKSKLMETTGNFLLLMFIVLGAAIFSIYISGKEQSIWFKLFAIAYFSFLPAWLYLDFISKKGRTLWEEFVLNLYRLKIDNITNLPKPPLNSLFYDRWKEAQKAKGTIEKEYKTIYQKKFEGLFGVIPADEKQSEGKNAFSVFNGENLWPVAIVTLLISFGWVLVTEPEPIFGRSAFPSFDPNSRPELPLATIRFGFLGSYFYILQMLVRRYFQNDLKTSAYISCILRIIVVTLLVWVLGKVWGNEVSNQQQFAIAFLIGIFPMVGLQALQAIVRVPLKMVLPSLKQKFPLNELDGLNIWYESRLLEEGIEDMQNLATANLVDVMLNTRIPVERLVDWVDQSVLYLHIGDGDDKESKKAREIIRRYGIRTATDLEDAFNGWQKNIGNANYAGNDAARNKETDEIEEKEINKDFVKKLERILNKDDNEPSMLRSILATFKKEPNLDHVRCWRSFTVTELKLQKMPDK